MLDADAAEQWMEMVSHVTRRKNPRHVGSAHAIDQQAVVDRKSRAFEDPHRGPNADRDDREVATESATFLGDCVLDPIRALQPDHLVAGHELHAPVAMYAGHHLAPLRAEDGHEWGTACKNGGYT